MTTDQQTTSQQANNLAGRGVDTFARNGRALSIDRFIVIGRQLRARIGLGEVVRGREAVGQRHKPVYWLHWSIGYPIGYTGAIASGALKIRKKLF